MGEARSSSGQIAFGLALIAVGLMLLVNNLLDIGDVSRLWPLIVIWIGAAKLARPSPKDQREGSGLWLVMIGTWLLLNTLHVMRWRNSWPLVLVAIGINMIWRAFASQERPAVEETNER